MELVAYLAAVSAIRDLAFWITGTLYGLLRRPAVYFPLPLAGMMAAAALGGVVLFGISGIVLATLVFHHAFSKRDDYRRWPTLIAGSLISLLCSVVEYRKFKRGPWTSRCGRWNARCGRPFRGADGIPPLHAARCCPEPDEGLKIRRIGPRAALRHRAPHRSFPSIRAIAPPPPGAETAPGPVAGDQPAAAHPACRSGPGCAGSSPALRSPRRSWPVRRRPRRSRCRCRRRA